MDTPENLSHQKWSSSIETALATIAARIKKAGDLPHVSVKEQLDILHQLPKFELGRYLLERGGVNAYWTDYAITQCLHDQLNPDNLQPLEAFLFFRSPIILAHRERIEIYQREANMQLKEGATYASIPCGRMRDLLEADYSSAKDFTLLAIDLDQEALDLAEELAKERGLLDHVKLMQKDAWNLGIDEEVDLIVSHGLNVYEPNPERVKKLYQQFLKALKPGGRLIISTLTPHPGGKKPSEWQINDANKDDMRLDRILFYDVLKPKWDNLKTSKELCDELIASGFVNTKVELGSLGMVPAVIAHKP